MEEEFINLNQKRDKNLYYKFVTMQYEQYNMSESENAFLESILKEIIHQINEQIYIRDFKLFLSG